MANGKKRRKQKKRKKLKTDRSIPCSNGKVKIITVNSSISDNLAPAILAPAYKNFRYKRVIKSKNTTFFPPSCITSHSSTPYRATDQQQSNIRYHRPPVIKTIDNFDGGPVKTIGRRKFTSDNTVVLPTSCLHAHQVKDAAKIFNCTYPKPPVLEKVPDITTPTNYNRNRKRWVATASTPIVPLSCTTKLISVVKTLQPQPQKKLWYPPPQEYRPSPTIIGPERKGKRHYKRYGDNNVIVSNDCIIQPKPIGKARSYDWRNAFPKPIALEKVAEILGPEIKIRAKKRYHNGNSFVPASCIIVPENVSDDEATKPREEAEAMALAAETPTTDTDSNLYLLAVAVIVALVMFAIVISR
ncbi:hypothetical protein V6C27_07800 [Peptococcaceae bacterium 1198_IL3148]